MVINNIRSISNHTNVHYTIHNRKTITSKEPHQNLKHIHQFRNTLYKIKKLHQTQNQKKIKHLL